MYSIGKAHLHAQFNLSIVIILCCFFIGPLMISTALLMLL
jgi:hypothetical protein